MKFQRFFIAATALAFAGMLPGGVRAQDDAATTTLFITEDSGFSIELPDGWFAGGDIGGLQVANREELITNPDAQIDTAGDLAFYVLPLAKTDLESVLSVAPDASLVDVATAVKPLFESGDGSTVISDPEDLDGAARMTVSDDTNDGVIWVGDYLAPGYLGVVVMVAPKGEMTEDAETTAIGLIESIQFSLTLSETFADANANLGFSYPAEWVTQDNGDGSAILVNSTEALDNLNNGADVAEGEVRFIIVGEDTPGDGVADEDLQAAAASLAANLTADSTNNPVVAEPVILVNDLLQGTIVYVEITSDIANGGLIMVNRDGVVHEVIFQGDTNLGDTLLLTAINISSSLTYTPVAQ